MSLHLQHPLSLNPSTLTQSRARPPAPSFGSAYQLTMAGPTPLASTLHQWSQQVLPQVGKLLDRQPQPSTPQGTEMGTRFYGESAITERGPQFTGTLNVWNRDDLDGVVRPWLNQIAQWLQRQWGNQVRVMVQGPLNPSTLTTGAEVEEAIESYYDTQAMASQWQESPSTYTTHFRYGEDGSQSQGHNRERSVEQHWTDDHGAGYSRSYSYSSAHTWSTTG